MNNLELIVMPSISTEIIAAKLWIKEGSRSDPQGQKGLHHMLGALLSRGCGPYDNISLADLVEGCGAGLRCDVNEDGLIVSLKCSSNDALNLLPILGWMIKSPHLDKDQILLERQLTIQALQRQKENPFHLAFDGWRKLAYKSGPYGHDPMGHTNDLLCIDRDKLVPIAEELNLRPSVLVIAGKAAEEISDRLLELEPFNYISKREVINKSDDPIHPESNKGLSLIEDIHLTEINTNQVVIMLGKSTIPHGHNDDLLLRLIGSHLSAGMSSLLFRKLREEHGVAYDVGLHHPSREHSSPFVLNSSTSEEKALLTLKLLMESWKELKERQLTNGELSLAKAKFYGQLAHGSQTSSQRAERQAQLKAFGLSRNYDRNNLVEIDNITGDSLMETARQHLNRPLLSLSGPKKALKELSEYWNGNKFI